MKKRIICMLLAVLMVMSVFSGLTFTASAGTVNGANTIEYTMQNGDYVLRICQKLGLNYYTCKQAIMILNNINESQWNKLAVGRVLILPASDQDAILIANGGAVTTQASGTTAITGTATTGTPTTVATTSTVSSIYGAEASADVLAYYLVPYTMSIGDTVSGVCNSLGVNYSVFHAFIQSVNANVSNWPKLQAGQTILVPTPVCPAVGTYCYGVMQHKVTSNDTAYTIATKNGVNYNANRQLLEAINLTGDLSSIQAGKKFYYPVPLSISVPGTGNPGGTTTTTTTTTTTDGSGTSTTTTTTTSKLYKLESSISSSDGTMLFYVDNKPVTAAPAGAKVTIVTDTASGKAIQSLIVKHSNGAADMQLSADAFIMPSCDVRVDALIKTGHDITIEANYSGKASATVGGISVMSAVKGAAVMIKSTDPNYEIDSIYVYYKKLISSSDKTPVTVSSSNGFVMPDMPVTVEIVLKPVSTYAFYVNDPANGSFYLQVNGSPATRAAKGAQVTIVTKAMDGFEPKSLTVKNHLTGAAVSVFSNTFTMPAFDVDVEVTFGSKGNTILIMPAQGGDATASIVEGVSGGVKTVEANVTEAETGAWVMMVGVPEAGYTQSTYDVVRNSDGLKVKVNKDTAKVDGVEKTFFSFTMPKGGVTVTPVFVGKTKSIITAQINVNGTAVSKYSDCSFSVIINGKKTEFLKTNDKLTDVANGDYIDLRYDASEGLAFIDYKVYVKEGSNYELNEELTNQANLHGYFPMPAADIVIIASFETGKVAIGPAAITGVGTVGYQINSKGTIVSTATCDPGDKVTIIVKAGNGYVFDHDKYQSKLVVTRKDNGAPLTLTKVTLPDGVIAYTFIMPAEGVNVQATFDPKPFKITMYCVDEVGKPFTGQSIWQIAVNGVVGAVDNDPKGTVVEVAYEDYIVVAMTESGYSNYDMISFRIDGKEYTADVKNYFYNFQMIDERAKDLEIIAVMRPRVPYSVSIHSLSATYNTTLGGVEFLILDSPTGYSDEYRFNSVGALNYVKKAVSGDKVAIVATSIDSKYEVKLSDVSIVPSYDADKIIPEELWCNPITGATHSILDPKGAGEVKVFVFTMPDCDVSISVNFKSTKQSIFITVLDMAGNPVDGMVRLLANDVYRDVASGMNFDDIGYGTTVQILRSELAIAQNKKISKVDIVTGSGDGVKYYDLSSYGEGVYFTMPDGAVWVVIKIDDYTYSYSTIAIDQVYNGHLEFRSGPLMTDPLVTEFKAGDDVYVFAIPDTGYAPLGVGDLKVLVNGMANAANLDLVATIANLTPVWKFKVPAGSIVFQATFQPNLITLTLSTAPANSKVSISGYGTYKDGDKIQVDAATVLTFASGEAGYDVVEVGSLGSGIDWYEVPNADSTVLLYLSSSGNALTTVADPSSVTPIVKVSSTSGMSNPIDVSNIATGAKFYIEAQDSGSYVPTSITFTDVNGDAYTTGVTLVSGVKYEIAAMPAGGLTATVHYELKTVKVKFVIPAGYSAKVSINGGAATEYDDTTTGEIPLKVGDTISFTSNTSGATITKVNDGSKDYSGGSYTVPNSDSVVTLTFTFAS